MAVGDRHTFFDGYSFIETLHGPMVWGVCVDCGDPTLVVVDTGRINQHGLREDVPTKTPRCSRCGRLHYTLDNLKQGEK